MVCSRNFFRLLTKSVKPFPKYFVQLRTECAWEMERMGGGRGDVVERGGGAKFNALKNFTILFTLCLIFIMIWSTEDLLFKIRAISKQFSTQPMLIFLELIYFFLSYYKTFRTWKIRIYTKKSVTNAMFWVIKKCLENAIKREFFTKNHKNL